MSASAHRARLMISASWPPLVGLGLALRYGLSGAPANFLGVAMWSVLVYTLIVFVAPRMRVTTAAVTCLLISWAVEAAQLTPVPLYLVENVSWLFQLALGSSWDPADLPAYAFGVAAAALGHRAVRDRLLSAAGSPPPENATPPS